MTHRSVAMSVAAALCLLLGGCAAVERLYGGAAAPQAYATVTALYDEVGGAQWCGGDLRVSLEPAVGSCGDDEVRVALAAAYAEAGEIVQSVDHSGGDGDLLVLVPSDVEAAGAWFQLRSADRALLEEARATIGGDVLEGPDEVADWVARNRGALDTFLQGSSTGSGGS